MAFKLKAADGPNIAIPDGEYYFNTKARGRRMMLNSLSSDARRVYACLELATMGFQQELAVTMERGEQRPLTPTDIKQQTGLLKQAVSRGLLELEDAGLALRKASDGGALRKGSILIYSWAVPLKPKEENGKRARLPFPDWFPESWEPLRPFISRYKYSLIDDEVAARVYFDEVAEAARVYQEAELVVARALEKVCAGPKAVRPTLYGKNGKNLTERTTNGRTDGSEHPVRPSGWAAQKGKLLTYLTQHFDRPTPPDDVVLNPLADLISDEPLFLQFQEACKGFKPQNGWKGFLPIAKAVVASHSNYMQAKAAAGPETESPLDRMMRMQREGQPPERSRKNG